jgi:hypothetical protein
MRPGQDRYEGPDRHDRPALLVDRELGLELEVDELVAPRHCSMMCVEYRET